MVVATHLSSLHDKKDIDAVPLKMAYFFNSGGQVVNYRGRFGSHEDNLNCRQHDRSHGMTTTL